MIGTIALLILAFGPLQWTFPVWVWVLTILLDGVNTAS